MYKKKLLILILLLTFITLTGCTEVKTGKTDGGQVILYNNSEVGVKVNKIQDWTVDQEKPTKQFNVTFVNGSVKAIITVISNEKPIEQIKHELIVGAGKVSLIEEKSDYLALKSERNESIRTDIYISRNEYSTGIITFMTPAEDYEKNLDKIEALKRNVEFL